MFNVWILERLYAVKGCPRSDCFILLPEGGRQWSQGAFGWGVETPECSFVLTLQPASSSAAPAWMDVCDHCLHTRCYELVEVAIQYTETQCVCAHATASGIQTFAHTASCLCVERMKVVFRSINMTVPYINMRQKKYYTFPSCSFPVCVKKCAHPQPSVIRDNKIRALAYNSLELQNTTWRSHKNYLVCFFQQSNQI